MKNRPRSLVVPKGNQAKCTKDLPVFSIVTRESTMISVKNSIKEVKLKPKR